jgi:hypothetical protein
MIYIYLIIFRKKIKEGYFNKVRHDYSPKDSNITDTRDYEYVYPIYCKKICK